MPDNKEELIDLPSEGNSVDVEVDASAAQQSGEGDEHDNAHPSGKSVPSFARS